MKVSVQLRHLLSRLVQMMNVFQLNLVSRGFQNVTKLCIAASPGNMRTVMFRSATEF
jgi:hypothetical protein